MNTNTFRAFIEPDYDTPIFIDAFETLPEAKKAVREVANNVGNTDFSWMETSEAFFLLGNEDSTIIYAVYRPGFDFDGVVQ